MNNEVTEVIAYHGWGLTSDFWNPIKRNISGNVKLKCPDRGYFGNPSVSEFSNDAAKKILMTHSFGLLICPKHQLEQADHLVVISGFLHFHPEKNNNGNADRSRLLLQQMMGRFVEKPQEVLEDYYKSLFSPVYPLFSPPQELDHEMLLEDLSLLNSHRISIQSLHDMPSITILHGESDRIIPKEKARSLYHLLRYNSQYFEIKQAGHGLPYTHSLQCYRFLKPVFENLQAKSR